MAKRAGVYACMRVKGTPLGSGRAQDSRRGRVRESLSDRERRCCVREYVDREERKRCREIE